MTLVLAATAATVDFDVTVAAKLLIALYTNFLTLVYLAFLTDNHFLILIVTREGIKENFVVELKSC